MEVEGIEVDGCSAGKVFNLALAQVLAGAAFDGFHRGIEGPLGALDGGQLPQPVGVLLGGEVQHRIGRVQVRLAGLAVSQPGHRDLTEDGREPASMPDLHPRPRGSAGVGNLESAFPQRPQVNVVLEQQTKQLPPAGVELLLKFAMLQAVAGRSRQPALDSREAGAGRTEGLQRG